VVPLLLDHLQQSLAKLTSLSEAADGFCPHHAARLVLFLLHVLALSQAHAM